MYTKIIQVKIVPKKTAVGYSRTFITKKTTRLAALPIGYYEGYDRGFSNLAWVMIRGKKCPVRGRVSMNLTMVDVSTIPEVKVGDTVTLLARSKAEGPTADLWGRWLGSINYEASTRLNSEIPRIYTTR
jgi:alanine racemase